MITDLNGDDPDLAILNAQIAARIRALKNILRGIREKQTLSALVVNREMRRAQIVQQNIEQAFIRQTDDRKELMSHLFQVLESLKFLKLWASDFAPLSSQNAAVILERRFVGATPDEKLNHCRKRVELLLQARPHSKNFWDLSRQLTEDIDDALCVLGSAYVPSLTQYRAVIQWIAPAWVFQDRTALKTPPRYGIHATRVTSVVVSGPPGSGKRN